MDVLSQISLFSGVGCTELGLKLVWPELRTVCYVENDAHCQRVLQARMRDGCLDDAPIWDDVTTFDGRPWRGLVDIISGGFPCQDISCAGKGAGIRGKRSGLWEEMRRIVCEVRPELVVVENVSALLGRGMGVVLGDLAEAGYDSRWTSLPAWAVGAPHKERDRTFIFAHASGGRYARLDVSVRQGRQAKTETYPVRHHAPIYHIESRGRGA